MLAEQLGCGQNTGLNPRAVMTGGWGVILSPGETGSVCRHLVMTERVALGSWCTEARKLLPLPPGQPVPLPHNELPSPNVTNAEGGGSSSRLVLGGRRGSPLLSFRLVFW